MNAHQENKLSMYLTVQTVCGHNQTTWQTLPAFAAAYADFGTYIASLQTLAQNQTVDSTGLSADKTQFRRAMAVAAVEIAGATNAYARKAGNHDLIAKTNVSLSTFMGGRDTLAAANARNIHDTANANLAALADYGVTAAKLTSLQDKIDAYADSISRPREAVASGSTVTRQMADAFKAADAVLKGRMDTLISQFEAANPTFVKDYRNARIIVDNTGGGGAAAPATTPPPSA